MKSNIESEELFSNTVKNNIYIYIHIISQLASDKNKIQFNVVNTSEITQWQLWTIQLLNIFSCVGWRVWNGGTQTLNLSKFTLEPFIATGMRL